MINFQKLINKSKRSKADICEEAGIRVQRLNEWLRGEHEPKFSSVEKILQVLGYKVRIVKNKK